jgi:hypothetical protein
VSPTHPASQVRNSLSVVSGSKYLDRALMTVSSPGVPGVPLRIVSNARRNCPANGFGRKMAGR